MTIHFRPIYQPTDYDANPRIDGSMLGIVLSAAGFLIVLACVSAPFLAWGG